MNTISMFLKYRPLSIMAMCGAARDIILGIGFIIGWDQITRTLIYQNYDDLIPGVSGPIVGALMVIIGVVLVAAALQTKRRFLVLTLKVQTLIWLFSTLMYILNGYFVLAVVFGLFFCIPSGFMAFYIKNNPPLDESINTLRRG